MGKQKNLTRKMGRPTKFLQVQPTAPQTQNIQDNGAPKLNSCEPTSKRLKFTIDSLLSSSLLMKVSQPSPSASTTESLFQSLTQNSHLPVLECLKVHIPSNSNFLAESIHTNIRPLKEHQHHRKLPSKCSTSQKESTACEGEPNPPQSSSPLQQLPNWAPMGQPSSSSEIGQLKCRLDADNKKLWEHFDRIGTEMIITKPGRRMFPTIKVRVENCIPEAMYYVYLDCIPVDGHRYRYVYTKSAWCSSGKADATPPSRLYMHPDSPFSGAQLATSPTISFEKAKLTNNMGTEEKDHLLILNSMHKYQPRVHILQRDKVQLPLENGGQSVDLERHIGQYKTFQFRETRFMAVTAYQNQLVTKMKIKNNPFAKGFRENDKSDSIHRGEDLENHSTYSRPSPPPFHTTSFVPTSDQPLMPPLPPNNLVTFGQIAPLALAAIQHLPSSLQPPPPIVPLHNWTLPWVNLPGKEQQSFLFYYPLACTLAMRLANGPNLMSINSSTPSNGDHGETSVEPTKLDQRSKVVQRPNTKHKPSSKTNGKRKLDNLNEEQMFASTSNQPSAKRKKSRSPAVLEDVSISANSHLDETDEIECSVPNGSNVDIENIDIDSAPQQDTNKGAAKIKPNSWRKEEKEPIITE